MKWRPSQILHPRSRTSAPSSPPTAVPTTGPVPAPKTVPNSARALLGTFRPTKSDFQAKWHREITACRSLHEFLATGTDEDLSTTLHEVQIISNSYLNQCKHVTTGSAECDDLLESLINEHAVADPSNEDVAVISCVHVLSASAARRRLESLLHSEPTRYVRCLVLVGRLSPSLLPVNIVALATALHQLTCNEEIPLRDLKNIRKLIEIVGSYEPDGSLPLLRVHNIILNANVGAQTQGFIQGLLEKHQYLTAFKSVAWLKSVEDLANRLEAIAILDLVLPLWKFLRDWEPEITRVIQFEQKGFSEWQFQRLGHILALEGPDMLTGTKTYLARILSECCRPQSGKQTLEVMLKEKINVLAACQLVGPHTIDLYARFCPTTVVEDADMSCIVALVDANNDECSHGFNMILGVVEHDHGLNKRLELLTKALPKLKALTEEILHREPLSLVLRTLDTVMSEAQDLFCKTLENASAEFLGMRILNYGHAILQTISIHPMLSKDFLLRLGQIPTKEAAVAVFDRIKELSKIKKRPICECRFKSYIASVLGGKMLDNNSVTHEAIQREISFWKNPPDTMRQDLARAMSKVGTIPYSVYTSWLLAILKEHDEFVCEVKPILTSDIDQSIVKLGNLLTIRRRFNQMQDETWLLLFAFLVQDRGPTYLRDRAKEIKGRMLVEFIENLSQLVQSVRTHLPQFGAGLAQEQLDWWDELNHRKAAVQTLLRSKHQDMNLDWLYLPDCPTTLRGLLDMLEAEAGPNSLYTKLLVYLSDTGDNILDVYECFASLPNLSTFGTKVFKRQLSRHSGNIAERLSDGVLKAAFQIWISDTSVLDSRDEYALSALEKLLMLHKSLLHSNKHELTLHLHKEYQNLLKSVRRLERLRFRLNQINPKRTASILRSLRIENSNLGQTATSIPKEVADSIEIVERDQYEISFSLLGLSDLQRKAKGISQDSRLFILRAKLKTGSTKYIDSFCFHFSPDYDESCRHILWKPTTASRFSGQLCNTPPTLFTYYVGRQLEEMVLKSQATLGTFHSTVSQLITSPPEACICCTRPIGVRLWKPAACSRECSRMLRRTTLETRLHNLMVDPKAIDLLLTGIYATAQTTNTAQLLPYCPVPTANLLSVIDSMPPLSGIQTANDLRSAIQRTDVYGRDREKLLSWLALGFRGFMLSISNTPLQIPSLGVGTEQFILLNSNHERETAANIHYTPTGGSMMVFHGTTPARLFPILTGGLKVASHTPLQLNGASGGSGIYCAEDPQTSIAYSQSTGGSWVNSGLKNLRVLLGCELIPISPGTHNTIHVIKDETRLLVRYIFLLSPSAQVPARAHIEPAMRSGIATLRSGLKS